MYELQAQARSLFVFGAVGGVVYFGVEQFGQVFLADARAEVAHAYHGMGGGFPHADDDPSALVAVLDGVRHQVAHDRFHHVHVARDGDRAGDVVFDGDVLDLCHEVGHLAGENHDLRNVDLLEHRVHAPDLALRPFEQVVQQHEGALGDVVAHRDHLHVVFADLLLRKVYRKHVENHLQRADRRPQVVGDHRVHLVAGVDRGLQLVALPHDRALCRRQIDVVRYAGDQLLVVERLGDVVAGSQFEPLDDVLGVVQRREENHRDVLQCGVCLQVPDHLVAVHVGHHDVQQDQVGGLLCGLFERLVTSRCRDDLVFGTAQHGFQQHDVGGDVVDGQDRIVLGVYGDVFHEGRFRHANIV